MSSSVDVRPSPVHRVAPKYLERTLQYGTAIVLALLIGLPIVALLYQSLLNKPFYEEGAQFTFANYTALALDDGVRQVLLNTLIFGVSSTLIALVIGIVLGLVIQRFDIPFAKLLGELQIWPLYISPLVLALGWVMMYGPSGYITLGIKQLTGVALPSIYNLAGMSIISGIVTAPFATLFALGAMQNSDPSLERAARSVGASPLRSLRSISLPLLRPAMSYSLLFLLAASLEELSIPLIIGSPSNVNLVASYILVEGLNAPVPRYGLVAAMSIVLLIGVAILVSLQNAFLGDQDRFVTVKGKATASVERIRLGKVRWLYGGLAALYLIIAIIVPLLGVIVRAFTSVLTPLVPLGQSWSLGNWRSVFDQPLLLGSIWNSLRLAIVGGLIGTLVVLVIVLIAKRSPFRYRNGLEQLAMAPRALPAIVIGIGFFMVALYLHIADLRASLLFMGVVFLIRYIPSGFGALAPAVMGLSADFDRSATTMGASWARRSRSIIAPLMWSGMLAAFVLIFVQFIKEYAAAIYLVTPDTQVMGVSMLSIWQQGYTGQVAVLAVIQLALTAVVVYAVRLAFGLRVHA